MPGTSSGSESAGWWDFGGTFGFGASVSSVNRELLADFESAASTNSATLAFSRN